MLHGAAVFIALVLLSLIVGFSQIKTEGLGWQEAHYMPRLEAVVAGEAPAPWQYRVLTDNLVVAVCRAAEFVGIPRPVGITFGALRLLQNMAIFALAFFYYRKLGLHTYALIIGLSALAWGMTQSNYGSDLAFNAYTDILFYLGAALVLLHRRYEWLIPITVLAALNRETSGLLPVMALVCAVPLFHAARQDHDLRRNAVIALGLYAAIQIALWLNFGVREWVVHPSGATPGLSMLHYNLGNDAAWGHVAGTLGIVPLLALLSYRSWHPLLRPLFWAVAPAWILIHLFCAPLDESRVLLLPQVLVFIPGMLCGLAHWREGQDEEPKGGLVA
ncbi:MAG: hypothetical protein L3K26_20255 [Candidatus Hydrogenedentes bacterium]|nr:hypothetical protein [Candidatus Hydrogenedentota bacterium]